MSKFSNASCPGSQILRSGGSTQPKFCLGCAKHILSMLATVRIERQKMKKGLDTFQTLFHSPSFVVVMLASCFSLCRPART